MKCRKGFDLEVMQSGAGYYIGTRDDEGFPNCRITGYYSKKGAELALKEDFENKIFLHMRICVENNFCNDGKGCFCD